MQVIYQIRNTINGKRYIGSAQDWETRKRKHKAALSRGGHHSAYLQNAWNKYGEHCFVFEILQQVEQRGHLLKEEQRWLDREKTYNRENGYNVCTKAGSGARAWTEEQREKLSKSISGEKHHFYGKRLSEEHREKISRSNKGKLAWNKGKSPSPETIEKMRECRGEKHHFYGKRQAEETKRKISESLKGHTVSEQTRKKLSAANLGKRLTEEHKQKLSDSSKRSNRARSVLTEQDVCDIREMCLKGTVTQKEIAEKYGISQPTVSAIKREKLWKE